MKKQEIIIKSDIYGMGMLIFITFIADFLLIYFGIKEHTLLSSAITGIIISIVVTILCVILANEKLIICSDFLCHKLIRKKLYSISDVKQLHIVKAKIPISRLATVQLKSKYVIIYLKNNDFEIQDKIGNINFTKIHGKHILFTTRYDDRAIEFFKSKGTIITGEFERCCNAKK